MNILLFDIDGTLTRSGGAGRKAFDRVFARLYQEKNASEGLEFSGKTDPVIIREIFQSRLGRIPSENELIRVKRAYLKMMEEEARSIRPYQPIEGIVEILKILSVSEHVLVGLATGNFRESAFLKLQSAGLRKFFSFGGFGSDSPNRFELTRLGIERGKKLIPFHEKFHRAFVIGDTPHDIEAGKSSGAVTIAMLTGATSREEMESSSPDHILSGYSPTETFLSIVNGHRVQSVVGSG
ncbi:MAG: HAD hydrolase-like protein [Candidatus Omnitrophica bacterium]|nr:HAD hydrolase-like protein [Candidatus Omnitrophota bacterium]